MVKQQLTKFVKVLLPFCILLLVSDYIIGSVFEAHYNNQKQGALFRISYAINKAKADYLVVGSSRATHHYDSDIINKITGHSFYNAGSEGRGITYSGAVVSAITHRYRPKLVIIDVRPNEFALNEDEDLATLLPYHKNKFVLPYINLSDFQNIKLLSKIYPYNSLLTTIIAGESNRVDYNTFDRNGYIPMEGVLEDSTLTNFDEKQYKVDSIKIKVFKELISQLERQKIKSLVVISPMYWKYSDGLTVDICKNTMASLKYSSFISFGNRKEFNSLLFKDVLHLNRTGAELFSTEIANLIKSHI